MPEQSDSEEEDEDQELQSEPANRKERFYQLMERSQAEGTGQGEASSTYC